MANERRSPSWKSTDWRGGAGAAGSNTGTGKPARGRLRFFMLAAALAIVGVLAGLFMYLRKPERPIFLSITVTEYVNRSLPPNPWAKQDGEALRAVFGSDSVQAFQSQERDLILRELAQLADRTTTSAEKKRPVLVHLCAHAVVRNETIYLLAGFSQPDSPASWLKWSDVLDVLRRCAGSSLIILDIARPIADARLGFLNDDASAVLHAELKRLEAAQQLPFLVLTSCQEGELSHTSGTLRRSLFGFFVEQGLNGHADGWDSKQSKDGQVSARELANYVRTQVAEFAMQQRLSAQTPTLYGTGKDFVLITPRAKPTAPAIPEALDGFPEWLTKGWLVRDQWLQDDTWRSVPRTFRQLESALVRAEQRWLAGDDAQSIQNEWLAEWAELEKQRRQLTPANHAPYSLALAERQKRKDDPGLAAKLQGVTDRLQSKTPLMAGELDMLWQKAFEKPPEASQNDAIAAILFRTLVEIPDPTREQLKATIDTVTKLQPKPRHLELQLVQLLVDMEPAQWQRWLELPGTVHTVLHTGQLAERLAAADPRALPWLRSQWATANTRFRDGLLALSIGEARERQQGKDALTEAEKLYQTLLSAALVLEQGFQRLEDAYRLLPAVAPELGRRERDADDKQQWQATVANVDKLALLLSPPTEPHLPPAKEIEALAQDLLAQFNHLQQRYQSEGLDRQLRRLNTPNAPTAADLFGQLRSPAWTAAQRGRLYAAAAKLERETSESALARSAQLATLSPLPPNNEKLRDAPQWRGQLAFDLLRLDGISATASLQADLTKAQGSSAAAWHDFGASLRVAGTSNRVKQFKDSTSLARQERTGWFLSTDDLPAVSAASNEPFPREPAAVLRRRQQLEHWRWLSDECYVKYANAFLKIATRAELAAFGRALNDVGRELLSRAP